MSIADGCILQVVVDAVDSYSEKITTENNRREYEYNNSQLPVIEKKDPVTIPGS